CAHPGCSARRGRRECAVGRVARAVVLKQVASGSEAVAARRGAPADKQIEMAVAVEVAGNDARAALGEPRQGARIPMEVSLPVVDIEPVLERIVISPELV